MDYKSEEIAGERISHAYIHVLIITHMLLIPAFFFTHHPLIFNILHTITRDICTMERDYYAGKNIVAYYYYLNKQKHT